MTKMHSKTIALSCALLSASCSSDGNNGQAGLGSPTTGVTAGSAAVAAPPSSGGAGAPGTGAAGRSTTTPGTTSPTPAGRGVTGGVGAAGTIAAAGSSSGVAGSAGAAVSGGAGAAVAGSTAPASGGAGASAAGTGAGGSSAGRGGNAAGTPAAGSGGSTGTTVPGNGGVVNATIVVSRGMVFDGGGKRYTAGRALGDGSQSEDQQPVFKIESGGTLKNVVLGNPAADGVHCHGDATLENIVWEDIGEDAMTIKEKGTVTLNGGSAKNGDDKVFQINAESTFRISNFRADRAGKFIRQNGGTDFKVQVFIDKCDISNMDEAIFRTDSTSSTVEMTNTRYSNIGDDLFIGVSAGNIKQSGNTKY